MGGAVSDFRAPVPSGYSAAAACLPWVIVNIKKFTKWENIIMLSDILEISQIMKHHFPQVWKLNEWLPTMPGWYSDLYFPFACFVL